MLDHIGLILTVIFTQLFFFGILFYIKGIWLEETLYFIFLVFFMLLIYLVIRYYRIGRVYDKLSLKGQILNEYFIEEPTRSPLENQYNSMIEVLIELENEAIEKYDKDKKLQKMLVYRFVHQLKTPVSVLRLILENRKNDENFKKIDRNLTSIEYNLSQMIDFYRLEEFKNDFVTEKIFLNDICKESINNLKDYFINFGIYPKLNIEKDIYVYSDPKWITIVLHQLLTNAIKYSDRGQIVYIEAEKTDEDENVNLLIKDEGLGIKEAEQKKIFDLFYVGKNGRNNADSSGIGLYIVKRIINHLGHELVVESKLNEGSTFIIKF